MTRQRNFNNKMLAILDFFSDFCTCIGGGMPQQTNRRRTTLPYTKENHQT